MIGLLDCNNFFVSCERLFRPDLLHVPVAVLSSNDGCIVARSQEVKDLDIPMGVPYFQVKDILTNAGAVLFSSNFTLYRDISLRVMQTLEKEVGFCDVYSIDEAFFELPDTVTEHEVAYIRTRVMQEVGIPVSIGVASTKTLAKQASKIAKKKDGVCVLDRASWQEIAPVTSCGSIWGIGAKTVVKLRQRGITTAAELISLDRGLLRRDFGVAGERIVLELQGVPVYALGDTVADVQKSIMSTRSFEKNTTKKSAVASALAYHVEEVCAKLREKALCATTVSVMILPSRHGDFALQGGREEIVLQESTSATQVVLAEVLLALDRLYVENVPYKKAGIIVSGLTTKEGTTASLFGSTQSTALEIVDALTDTLNERFGHGTIRHAAVLTKNLQTSAKLRSQDYTTKWKDIPIVRA